MTIFGLTTGQRVTKKAAVSTSAVTLHTATKKMPLTLESIHICNTSAAARTVSLYVDTGAAQFYIFNDLALASKAAVLVSDHPVNLTDGEALKVIASGSGISVTASIVQSTPFQADPAQTTLSTVPQGRK